MDPLNVVLYQKDTVTAQNLAVNLSKTFEAVFVAATYDEIGRTLAQHRAEAVVIDLESFGPGEVQRLHQDFPDLCIVGTHRLADDKLWAEAMTLGASDICEPRHVDVVRSLLHRRTRHAAA
jgi:hypothetical protein